MPDRMKMRPLSGPKGVKLRGYRFKLPRSRIKTAGKVRFLKSRVGK